MNEARDELAQAMERLKAKGLCPLTLSVRGPGEAASVTAEGASSGVGPLHGTIFEVRPDAGAIVTARPRWASALWLLSQPMPGIFDEQVRQLGRRVDRLGDPEGLKSHHSAFLYDEGVVCLGVTLERAVFNVELLEKCAGRTCWPRPPGAESPGSRSGSGRSPSTVSRRTSCARPRRGREGKCPRGSPRTELSGWAQFRVERAGTAGSEAYFPRFARSCEVPLPEP